MPPHADTAQKRPAGTEYPSAGRRIRSVGQGQAPESAAAQPPQGPARLYSRTNFAWTLYSSLMVRNSSGSSTNEASEASSETFSPRASISPLL